MSALDSDDDKPLRASAQRSCQKTLPPTSPKKTIAAFVNKCRLTILVRMMRLHDQVRSACDTNRVAALLQAGSKHLSQRQKKEPTSPQHMTVRMPSSKFAQELELSKVAAGKRNTWWWLRQLAALCTRLARFWTVQIWSVQRLEPTHNVCI